MLLTAQIGYHHLSSVEPKVLTDTAYATHGDTFAGAWPRIVKAIETAGQHGLGVLIGA
jgi:glucan 1,3-beta-glucosidase